MKRRKTGRANPSCTARKDGPAPDTVTLMAYNVDTGGYEPTVQRTMAEHLAMARCSTDDDE